MVHEMRVGNLCGSPPTKSHTCHKIPGMSFLLNKKKPPAAAGKTSTGLIHVIKILGTSFLPRRKAPAAARKTSTGLIHVIKFQERHFCRKKRRLRQPGRPQQG